MYNGTGSNKKQRSTTTGYLARPRLGPARSYNFPRPSSSQDKKKKFKKSSVGKMEFRKKPDYADTAYREAVGRLRILLAESYNAPIKRPLRELDSAGEDTDNQSLVSANSRTSRLGSRPYYHHLSMLPPRCSYPSSRQALNVLPPEIERNVLSSSKFENSTVPPELMSFIGKQEDYIEQLEKESRFCKEELSVLLSKVKDVISENENLHERQKCNLMKSVFNHLETETETETDLEQNSKSLGSPKKTRKAPTLEGPTIVFESRISELEAQLTQAKIDLKKALEESDSNRKKISDGSLVDGFSFENYKKQIEILQREKEVLQDTVGKLQNVLAKIRDKENSTSDQVKRSLDVAEQAQYEKNAADQEIRRLKDELERQHAKLRDVITDQSRRVSDERGAVERRYTQQIEQLTTELGVQWETTNKLQLEMDKQRRENTDMRRELAQKQAMMDEMRKDTQTKIMGLQSDIGVSGAEKSALEQQIATLQMTNERNERQSKQEIGRLQAEMQSLRQRLDRADADLIHSRRENIRLSEQVASLEKEVNLNTALNEDRKKKESTDVLALPPPKKEQELSSLIQDMELKHAATVAELEGMIHSQNQLMDKLSVECHTLTQKLDDASTRHKEEIRDLQTSLDRLNNRFSQSQILSSSVKDEDYNPASYQTTAQPQHSTTKPSPTQSRNLSRTNSRTSDKYPSIALSRKNSQEKVKSPTLDANNYQYKVDPSVDQQYLAESDGDQQYTAQEQYNQQYATDPNQYDPINDQQYSDQYSVHPNQQYAVDPNQYVVDPSQQYVGDPNQHYAEDPNEQYVVDSNQEYASDPHLQYGSETNQQYESGLDEQYSSELNAQFDADPKQQNPKS